MLQSAELKNQIYSLSTTSDDYVCPGCRCCLAVTENALTCHDCGQSYPIEDGIPVFSSKRGYWCNVSREKMRNLIAIAEKSGDWLAAVQQHIPKYAPAVVPLYRADAQFLFPINSESRVLDAGSMWGGLTVPIAQFAKEVYAVDQTWETLRFLQTRARQMGLNNIIPVESSLHRLPFPDQFFDFIVLNGVLEWLGMAQDVVLEQHWNKKRQDEYDYHDDPRAMQLAALKELYRVIKPGGGIYIAIENRLGLQYFVGHPDDHMNVRFVTFLPRALASWVTKRVRNAAYRTYVYSPVKLSELVEEAGFKSPQLYAAYPHYGKISRLVPFSIFNRLGRLAKSGYAHIKVAALSALWNVIPSPVDKYFSPSLGLIASKSDATLPQRLIQLLIRAGVVAAERKDQYQLALVNNRFGNGHTTNYLVYDLSQQKPVYFCKISRDREAVALRHETDRLLAAASLFAGSDLVSTIPEVVYSGIIDGITLQVSRYVAVQPVSSMVWNGLRCLPRFLGYAAPVRFVQRFGRRRWLAQIDPWMMRAVAWLARFQQLSKAGTVQCDDIVDTWINAQLSAIVRHGIHAAPKAVENFRNELRKYTDLSISKSMQHGDFDVCNLLNEHGKLFVVDFEHAEFDSLPFFDLANLIFSPFIAEWKWSGCQQSLSDYASRTGWQTYFNRWLDHYAAQAGINRQLLNLLPQFAALEQNAKAYPAYRDPYDYPMYGQLSFDALMGWNLCNRSQ